MNQSDDRVFIRKFSGIILGLIAFTAVIIALAYSLRSAPDPDDNPSQHRLAEERIAPVAGVHAGSEGQAALAAAATETPATAPAAAGAAATTADGEKIYQSVCMACHAAGVAGAPIPGSEVMAQRLAEKGIDGLVTTAINGLNVMPPKGGRPDLSDEDMRVAVEFMIQ